MTDSIIGQMTATAEDVGAFLGGVLGGKFNRAAKPSAKGGGAKPAPSGP